MCVHTSLQKQQKRYDKRDARERNKNEKDRRSADKRCKDRQRYTLSRNVFVPIIGVVSQYTRDVSQQTRRAVFPKRKLTHKRRNK